MPLNDNTAQWGVRKLTDFKGNGLPVGFEYFSTNPNIPAGSLPLFGGEYSRTVYSDLWSWVQEQPNYLLTEEEWQAKANANDGNVPYYSSGDGSTTFRVPSLKCWVKGANGIEEVGSFLSAGLPNITGEASWQSNTGLLIDAYAVSSGAFVKGAHYPAVLSNTSSSSGSNALGLDASRSNPIYGNSNTVQPKSIVGMWLVKAYGTVSNVGSTDVADIAQGLTEAETRIGQLENHSAGATVVESYRNGTEWYRKWSDGWLEQGGVLATSGTYVGATVVFLRPFLDLNYTLKITSYTPPGAFTSAATTTTDVASNLGGAYSNKTETSFMTNSRFEKNWYACGMGA